MHVRPSVRAGPGHHRKGAAHLREEASSWDTAWRVAAEGSVGSMDERVKVRVWEASTAEVRHWEAGIAPVEVEAYRSLAAAPCGPFQAKTLVDH